ncbi:MAG: metal-dependent hydrolase [Methanotrichaceae archaeon]
MLFFAHLGLTLAAASFFKRSNLTFVAIGSLLPDIIDKPLGEIVFGTPAMGRIFAHTLLFLMLLAILAAYTRDIRLISLSGGVLSHFVLDFMWNSPAILLWPLLGGFPVAEHLDPLSYIGMLLTGLRNPVIFIPECLGFVYLLYFIYQRRFLIPIWGNEAMVQINGKLGSMKNILKRIYG